MQSEISKIYWQYYILILISALVSCGINLLPIVVLWTSLWFYTGEYKRFIWPPVISWFWVFSLFFFLHVAGILYSESKTNALSLTQIKLGFLFFPILLNTRRFKKEEVRIFLRVFCFSNLFISTFLIVRAFFYFIILPKPIYTYSSFSIFIHPSYASLYFVFSIAVLFIGGIELSGVPKKDFVLKFLISFILTLGVLFCSSKIGYIILTLVSVFLLIYFVVKLKILYPSIISFIVLLCISFLFIATVPGPLKRLNNVLVVCAKMKDIDLNNIEEIKTTTVQKGVVQRESSMARIIIWNSSIEVVKENWLFGVGTGDVSEAMLTTFEKNHLYDFLSSGYGSHNQYLETEISIGLPGLIILLVLTIGSFVKAIMEKNLVLCIFSGLFILLFLVESMLEWQATALFFSLFLFLLINMNHKEGKPERQSI